MNLTKIVFPLAALAACATDSLNDPGSGPKQISFEFVNAPPALLSLREGSGDWQTLAAPYQTTVVGEVEAVVVCAEPTGFITYVMRADAADLSAKQTYYCGQAAQPARVNVTGQMVQPGTVAMQAVQTNTMASWSFTLPVIPGMHDLVAYDASHVMIRRGLSISGATSIPTVDLTGAPSLSRATAVVPGQIAGEKLTVLTSWQTPNDSVTFRDATNSLYAPPASLLAGDELTAEALLYTGDATMFTQRMERHPFTGAETSFALPPALSGVSFASTGTPSASWTDLPQLEWVGFGVNGASNTLSVGASISWISAHGATSLSFDDEPPGYQASWRVALAGRYTSSFYVSSKTATTMLGRTFGGT